MSANSSNPARASPEQGSATSRPPAVSSSRRLTSLLAQPDRVLHRINKLLANPGGLSAVLSSLNYTVYLLAFLDTKTLSLRQKLALSLSRTPPTGSAPNFLTLGSTLSQTRTTLRLFGILPLYAWFRQLSHGPAPRQDLLLYLIAITQCLFYLTFQYLENVAYLIDNKVLSVKQISRWTASSQGRTDRIYRWSYRAWLAGVLCDFIRLTREAQLERRKRARRSPAEKRLGTHRERDERADVAWWKQALIPTAWLPIALSSSLERETKWANMSVLGLGGLLAGLGRTMDLWAATAEVS